MPHNTPKSENLLKAQVAAFAAEKIEDGRDAGYVFDNVQEIALGGLQTIARPIVSDKFFHDKVREVVEVEGQSKALVAKPEEYTNFLRDVGGSDYESIRGRERILDSYVEYSPLVNRLKAELEDPGSRRQHPAFIGNGSNADAFRLQDGTKDYVVRLPVGGKTNPAAIDGHIAGGLIAKDIPHLEKMVAASYEDGVTISELAPGKTVGKLEPQEIRGITDEQIMELVSALLQGNERGLRFDPKPNNFLYDKEQGFTVVDIGSAKVVSSLASEQTIDDIFSYAATVLANTGTFGNYRHGPSMLRNKEDFNYDLKVKQSQLDLMKRFKSVVQEKFDGDEYPTWSEYVDKNITYFQDNISQLSNPQTVAEKIKQSEQEELLRLERKKRAQSGKSGWETVGISVPSELV